MMQFRIKPEAVDADRQVRAGWSRADHFAVMNVSGHESRAPVGFRCSLTEVFPSLAALPKGLECYAVHLSCSYLAQLGALG
jgi:hypothetical protein